jgi:glycosyltransferase involved in cell wall biosynthesis
LIIIDDGSKDNTAELMKQYSDERIHYHYQNNSERSAARNNGINRSKGKYICFLDSDDEFLPEHLSGLYRFIQEEKNPIALLYTDCYMVFEDGNKNQIMSKPEPGDPWHIFFLKNSIIPARICIHHEILKKIQFREDIVIVEDTVLWTTISLQFPVFHVQQSSIHYHWHDDNSVNIAKNCFLPRLNGLNKMFADASVGSQIPSSLKNELLSGCYFGIARHHELKRNFFSMVKNILLSIAKMPGGKQTKTKIFMIYAYLRGIKNVNP